MYQVHLLMVDTDLISRIFHERLNKWMWQNVHTQNTTWLSFLLIKSIQFFFLKYDTVHETLHYTTFHQIKHQKLFFIKLFQNHRKVF